MIIARAPLRISLGGGGTDLPSYYAHHGGFLVSAAINKYVYITIHETFVDEMIIKYSHLERVGSIDDIQHPIIRESLKLAGVRNLNLEITAMADIPAGTGLGSSGSFTTALLKAILAWQRKLVHPEELAEMACEIEIGRLGEPIGKQDQYIAALGGITGFTFHKDHSVSAESIFMSEEARFNLEDNLLLFFTGYARSASAILQDQKTRSEKNDSKMLEELHMVKDAGYQSKKALESGDLEELASIMHEHWERKRVRSKGMSNTQIDDWYRHAINNGALGGKLIGAGGGGFLMFIASNKQKLRHAMREKGLKEVRFSFDFEGTKTI